MPTRTRKSLPVVHVQTEDAIVSIKVIRYGKDLGRLQVENDGIRWIPNGKHREAVGRLRKRIPWGDLNWLQTVGEHDGWEVVRARWTGKG